MKRQEKIERESVDSRFEERHSEKEKRRIYEQRQARTEARVAQLQLRKL